MVRDLTDEMLVHKITTFETLAQNVQCCCKVTHYLPIVPQRTELAKCPMNLNPHHLLKSNRFIKLNLLRVLEPVIKQNPISVLELNPKDNMEPNTTHFLKLNQVPYNKQLMIVLQPTNLQCSKVWINFLQTVPELPYCCRSK